MSVERSKDHEAHSLSLALRATRMLVASGRRGCLVPRPSPVATYWPSSFSSSCLPCPQQLGHDIVGLGSFRFHGTARPVPSLAAGIGSAPCSSMPPRGGRGRMRRAVGRIRRCPPRLCLSPQQRHAMHNGVAPSSAPSPCQLPRPATAAPEPSGPGSRRGAGHPSLVGDVGGVDPQPDGLRRRVGKLLSQQRLSLVRACLRPCTGRPR